MTNKDVSENNDNEAKRNGLLDGRQWLLPQASEGLERALNSGTVFVDSSVLCDLYRYGPEARESLFLVLESLSDRLLIPSQVAIEFLSNRENVITGRQRELKNMLSTALPDPSEQSLNEWMNRANVQGELRAELNGILSEARHKMNALRSDLGEAIQNEEEASDSNDGNVLSRLIALLEAKVMMSPPVDSLEELYKEGHDRIICGRPPGAGDRRKAEKLAGQSARLENGDYLIFAEILSEPPNGEPSVLITSDMKRVNDWVDPDRKQQGKFTHAHPLLRKEHYEGRGTDFFAIAPAHLLELAPQLGVPVCDGVSDSVAQLANQDRERANSTSRLNEAAKAAGLGGSAQIAAFNEAAKAVGFHATRAAEIRAMLHGFG